MFTLIEYLVSMIEWNHLMLHLRISISFQIIEFNYKIISVEFENDKVWDVILKSSSLVIFITIVDLTQI